MNDRQTALLIKPGWRNEAAFPLGLACLSSVLKQAGWHVIGVDLDFDFFARVLHIAQKETIRAAILSVTHFQLDQTASLVRRLKVLRPDLPVVLVGETPTLDPEKTLVSTGTNLVIRGDPERIVVRALDFLQGRDKAPNGVVWMEDGLIREQGGIHLETDLEHLNPPDREFLPLMRYGWAYRSVALPFAASFFSRGCLSTCCHCPVPAIRNQTIAYRSPAAVADEMRVLSSRYGIQAVHFEDDAFAARPEKVAELCEELLKETPPLVWELVNGVRPRELDPSLFPTMAASGCRRIALGIETLGVPHDTVDAAWRHEPDLIRRLVEAGASFGNNSHRVFSARSAGYYTGG